MKREVETLLEEILVLPENDRAVIVKRVLESLEPEDDPSEVEAAWDVEIKRRIEEIKSGKAGLIPFEDVLAELTRRRKASG